MSDLDINEMNRLIGTSLRNLRIVQDKTIEDVADLGNLNTKYVGEVERGEHNISVTTLLKFQYALKIKQSNPILTEAWMLITAELKKYDPDEED
ncbi:helix-turn-helix domain-containing protein [Bacillus sp. FJAT-45037]|uniref:helix-turn-helix domain-containing protein n=1 Tax=Bacillus sp. FJAT-45037 TaxID=2011007 RepID=UPI000C244AC4|nr:helix-turn-helix transcriptional regulator [Bacillus sp. FJAT-45037]